GLQYMERKKSQKEISDFSLLKMDADSLFKALVNGIKMHLTSLQVKDSVVVRRIEED
ncbi:hypothetical protein Tco_0508661, partial [Tanacetum coccineum]